jgi:uracil-DNA glycosylase family 4
MLREMGIPAFWPVMPAVPDVPTALADAPVPAPAPAPPPKPAPVPVITAAPAPTHAVARPAGLDVLDWPALREAVAQCQACALCDKPKQSVFGVGHIEADWMIVGEAPGEEEDRCKVSPSWATPGQLLDRMLDACGLDPRRSAEPAQQVFIANVLKCRPPANRNPLPPEVAQCEPYLLRQMALGQPRVIVAMGRFAAQSLLKSTDAPRPLRGQGSPRAGHAGRRHVLTPPICCATLRTRVLVWDDLCAWPARCWRARGRHETG